MEKLHLITLAIVLLLGGATLLLHDERYIKWKPTALYWTLAIVLSGSQLLRKKNLIKSMFQGLWESALEEQIELPEKVWGSLNLSWVIFFMAFGILNLYVAFNFSTKFWVNFKVLGGMGLMALFLIGQFLFLAKYITIIEPDDEPE